MSIPRKGHEDVGKDQKQNGVGGAHEKTLDKNNLSMQSKPDQAEIFFKRAGGACEQRDTGPFCFQPPGGTNVLGEYSDTLESPKENAGPLKEKRHDIL